MARLLAIDYGAKRTGLAVTDPLGIIATALETIPSHQLFTYLDGYFEREDVSAVILGLPKNMDGSPTDATPMVKKVEEKFRKTFPDKQLFLHDERFTSKMALEAMIAGGTKKKDRRQKGNLDKISATIILQSYLESQT